MAAEVLEGLVGVCSLWGCFSVFFSFVFCFFFPMRIPGATGQPNTPITQQSTCLRSAIDGKVTGYVPGQGQQSGGPSGGGLMRW